MNILGIHIGHDSSAALVVDGKIVADVAEERFTRTKHYCGLPIASIDYCLRSQNLKMADIDVVAVPADCSVPDLNFLLDLKGAKRERKTKKRSMLEFTEELFKKGAAKPPLYIKNFAIKHSTEIVHVNHHLAHAASAYYTNNLSEKQLIVTMDGSGDGMSIALWRGENGKIELLQAFPLSASIGFFYSNVTEALGWWHGDGEGKTMGLAPYGDYTKAQGVLTKFHPKFSKGQVLEHHDFGRSFFWNEGGAIQWHYDEAYEIRDLVQKYGREHIAAEAQRVLEEQVQESERR